MNSRETNLNAPDPYKDFAEFYDIYVGNKLEDLPFYLNDFLMLFEPNYLHIN